MTRVPGVPRAALAVFAVAVLQTSGDVIAAERGGGVPPKGERTVSWYQANPAVMRRVMTACRNDPGHGWNDSDCINARAAELREDEKTGRRVVGAPDPFVSPADPRYWIIHPQELPGKLGRCAIMPPEAQRRYFCDAARTAARRTDAR